jgi:FkbM family methyltransferase
VGARFERLPLRLAGYVPPSLAKRVGAVSKRSPVLRRSLARATRSLRTTDVTIRRGACAGLRFNAGGSNPSYALGVTDPLEQELLERTVSAGTVFYDIGANVGFFTLLAARRVGAGGHVVAFEPLAENVATLQRNLALNGFEHATVVAAAVGDVERKAALQLGEQPMWGQIVDQPSGPAVEVDMVVIDQMVAAGSIPAPDYVKVDVEGGEVGVLEGMRATIERSRPSILCEVHGTAARVLPLLRDLGYQVRSLEGDGPVEAAPAWFHVIGSPL